MLFRRHIFSISIASFIFVSCHPSNPTEPTQLPTRISAISVETQIPEQLLSPTSTSTIPSTPTATTTLLPTSITSSTTTPTLAPTNPADNVKLIPECPFTFEEPILIERLGKNVQFPLAETGRPGTYIVQVVQSKNIVVDKVKLETENNLFGYINPGNIGIGWYRAQNGEKAYITFLNTGYVQTKEDERTYIAGFFITQKDYILDSTAQEFSLAQRYYLNGHSEDTDENGDPLYDDWESAGWSASFTNDTIRKPRTGKNDFFSLSIALPGDDIFPTGTTKDDMDFSEYGAGDIGQNALGPWINSLENYTQGITNFIETGDTSGLPTITIDGIEYPLLPTYRAYWAKDLPEDFFSQNN